MVEYRGESYGKKIARIEFWGSAITEQFRNPGEKIVVLASSEGGDVACLMGFGVPLENIVAVDSDAAALESCRAKWPGLDTRLGDVGDVVEELGCAPIGVFLDFCGSVSTPMVQKVLRIAPKIAKGGILGVAFVRGRDTSRGERIVTSLPFVFTGKKDGAVKERYMSGNYSEMIRGVKGEGGLRNLIPARDADKLFSSNGPLLGLAGRFPTFWLALNKVSRQKMFIPKILIAYQSRGQRSNGSPMGIILFRVLGRYTHRYYGRDHKSFEKGLRKNKGVSLLDLTAWTEEMVRTFCIAFRKDPLLHLKLNIPKGRIAAWRAHHTMGKYTATQGATK